MEDNDSVYLGEEGGDCGRLAPTCTLSSEDLTDALIDMGLVTKAYRKKRETAQFPGILRQKIKLNQYNNYQMRSNMQLRWA